MWRAGWWGAWWGHVHERVASGHRGPGHDDTHVLGRHRPQVHALGVAMRAWPATAVSTTFDIMQCHDLMQRHDLMQCNSMASFNTISIPSSLNELMP
jgi:hypothetical protein